jgi:hypothetical protein
MLLSKNIVQEDLCKVDKLKKERTNRERASVGRVYENNSSLSVES